MKEKHAEMKEKLKTTETMMSSLGGVIKELTSLKNN